MCSIMEQVVVHKQQVISYLDLLVVHRVKLVNGIKNIECILDNLLHLGYFMPEDIELIQHSATQHEKVRKTLNIISAKGEECAEFFLYILNCAKEIYSDFHPWLREIHYSPSERLMNKPVLITDAVCQYAEKLRVEMQRDTRFTLSYAQKEDTLFEDMYTDTLMELVNSTNEILGSISYLEDLFSDTGIINEDAETVFVTGDAGVGKTILLQRFQNLWSKGELCTGVKFLFKFRCRMFNSFRKEDKICLRNLLFKYNCYPDKDPDEIFSYIQQHPDSVLFTLDGFDEINVDCHLNDIPIISSPFDPLHPVALLMSLLHGKLLKGSKKLLTARTGTELPLRMVKKRVTLKGFSKDYLLQYSKKFFKNETQRSLVLAQLETNPHLSNLCSVPLFCWIIFKCYDCSQSNCSPQWLSHSVILTDIYLVMIEVFLNHSSQANPNKKSARSRVNLFRTKKEILMRIGKLALKGIENRNFAFSQGTVTAANISEEDLQLGFIKTVGHYNGLGNQSTYEYIHITLQSFFTAFLLVLDDEICPSDFLALFKNNNVPKLSNDKVSDSVLAFLSPTKYSSTHILKPFSKHLQFTMLFLCGLLSNSNTDLLLNLASPATIKRKQSVLASYLSNCMKTYLKKLPRLRLEDGCKVHVLPRFVWLIRYIFEMQNGATAKLAAKGICADYIKLNYCNVSSVDCGALAFILHHIRTPLALEMDNNNINDYGLKKMVSCFSHLTVLRLSVNQITDQGVHILVEELKKHQKIRSLGLYKNYISDVGARDVAELIEACSSLVNLRMGENMITHEGGTCLAKAIQKSKTIEDIGFWGNQIGDRGVVAFAEALENHQSLKNLSLAANQISSEGSKHLAKALCKNSSLKILWLTQNDLDDASAESFGEMLRVNTSLEKLWLIQNKITTHGATYLLQSLRENTTINEICLKDNWIPPNDASHLMKDKRIVI
ncbi:nucleotide-binding oligomerization domain-containing protein 1-like [Chiloscyllium plagiosum]|uniref:nucleotide-binding oligomerization domain-containing protein 1-like n=1 Tax=Chiloscyllium plagiosum TaxID=36176 RepID=UPI001CB864DC|nr:nucleotide-binding oligomerization domain-containing protein 1-like [Chiloscyllium plagiosum]